MTVDDGLPELHIANAEGELEALLGDAQAAVLTNPVAAQVIFTAQARRCPTSW